MTRYEGFCYVHSLFRSKPLCEVNINDPLRRVLLLDVGGLAVVAAEVNINDPLRRVLLLLSLSYDVCLSIREYQ